MEYLGNVILVVPCTHLAKSLTQLYVWLVIALLLVEVRVKDEVEV